MKSVTVQSPVNIAVIKYWGKKDEQKLIPLNNSISATLALDDLCATTTVALSSNFSNDRIWLNGKEECVDKNQRLLNCLSICKYLFPEICEYFHFGLFSFIKKLVRSLRPDIVMKVHICSFNNFPTAAGLASSAAGYSCLVYALGQLFDITDLHELSKIARVGSGSACRSIFGGFVEWISGNTSDDSYSYQIVDENYWPLRVLILVVNDKKKDVSSTSAMKRTVLTSLLLEKRIEILPHKCDLIKTAIKQRDFHLFAEITMQDSNQLHAICQDTYPPVRYMNDISWSIINLIHEYNNYYGINKVAYTYDAGPNACLYLQYEDLNQVYSLIKHFYPSEQSILIGEKINLIELESKLLKHLENHSIQKSALKSIIHTKIGSGPRIIEKDYLDSDGMPIE